MDTVRSTPLPLPDLEVCVVTPAADTPPDAASALLDRAAWAEVLEAYAQATGLTVTLTGRNGRPLGPWVQPRPLWDYLTAGRTPVGPFCLPAAGECHCVADALRTRAVTWSRDRTGLVHFAVPLVVADQPVGALVAGQAFDRSPERLALEPVARELGLAPAAVWQQAFREWPVAPRLLRDHAHLLAVLAGAFLQARTLALGPPPPAPAGGGDDTQRRLAAIGQAVAALSHESRNALHIGRTCLGLLGMHLEGQPEALGLVGRIQRALVELSAHLEEVREYAVPFHPEPGLCDLAAIWREAWADLGPLRPAGAVLREEAAGLDLSCPGSPFHLKQVFRNLLENALASAGDGARVTLACAAAELAGRPAVRVAVRDNGPGFAPGQRDKLFEPFFTTRPRGTGLGLAICKRIVEAHGGRIELGPAGGPGAEVVLVLPAVGG